MKPYVMLRVSPETHQRLRLIGALCNERLIQTIGRLAEQEYARLEKERQRTKVPTS